MNVTRNCKVCGKRFTAIKQTQFFCKRKCFKKDYYKRTKEAIAQQQKINPFFGKPLYKCPMCANECHVPFDPVKSYAAFDLFVCPFCGIPRVVVFEHQHDSTFVQGNVATSQYVIYSAIVSFSFSTTHQS